MYDPCQQHIGFVTPPQEAARKQGLPCVRAQGNTVKFQLHQRRFLISGTHVLMLALKGIQLTIASRQCTCLAGPGTHTFLCSLELRGSNPALL